MGIRRCQPLVLALWNEADGGLPAGLRGAAVPGGFRQRKGAAAVLQKDGTLREAVGTLCKGYSERFDNYEYKDEPGSATSINYDLFLYWDLEEDGYRSFSASRFIGFEVMENSEKYGQLSSRGSE